MSEFIHPAAATVEDRIVGKPARSLSPQSRWTSLAEFAIGGAIVMGHNVYHVIPNEVPILFLLGFDFLSTPRRRLGRNGTGMAGIVAAHASDRRRGGVFENCSERGFDRSCDGSLLATRESTSGNE